MYWASQSNFFLYNLVYNQFLCPNWLSWLHSANVSIDHLCRRTSFVLCAYCNMADFLSSIIFTSSQTFLTRKYLHTKVFSIYQALWSNFFYFFLVKFFRMLFIPIFYVKVNFPDYKVFRYVRMYQSLSLNLFGFTWCNLIEFFSYINFMSNLTFLTKNFLHKYKFVINFLLLFWMKFYRILFIASFYVRIDFPDYKVQGMYRSLSMNIFNFTQSEFD